MWTCAKIGAKALWALTDLTAPGLSPQGSPNPWLQPKTLFQPRPGPPVPVTGVLTSSSPQPCPETSPHWASPTHRLMSWCGPKPALSPQTCLTTWAELNFPSSLSLPCSPLSGRWDPFPASKSCWLDRAPSSQHCWLCFGRKVPSERSSLQMFCLDCVGDWSHLKSRHSEVREKFVMTF